jgi:predicted HicB family RNase H-like nuclease
MARRTLTAYGNQDDQDKLAVLAQEQGISVSAWIVKTIRDEYLRHFGGYPPKSLLRNPE